VGSRAVPVRLPVKSLIGHANRQRMKTAREFEDGDYLRLIAWLFFCLLIQSLFLVMVSQR
jgi:hypothetical protein